MGVPRFAYFITNRYPLIIRKIKEDTDIPEIDNLFIDINGIIHDVSHGNDILLACKEKTIEEIYKDVCEYINKIIQLIKPRKMVMISVDGIAPRSKMNQQRIRRFRKDRELTEEEKEIIKENCLDISKKFNSDLISAGTEFMFNLNTYIKEYIVNKKQKDKKWSSIEILFTGSDVPGEGEHKILEYIRNYKLSKEYVSNTRHCIYGLDADLVMLSLITHEPNIVILKEDKKRKQKYESKGIKVENKDKNYNNEFFELLFVSLLREYLELEFDVLKHKLKFQFNLERIIDDFVFLCFFIGNDFLPNLYSLTIETGAMNNLLDFYKYCLPLLDDYITNQGKINFHRAKNIFNLLAKKELHSIDMLLKDINVSSHKNNENRVQKAKEQIKSLRLLKMKEKKQKLIDNFKSKSIKEQKEFKINKKHKKIESIKKKFEELSNKINKKYIFDEEYDKYYQKINNNNSITDEKLDQNIEKLLNQAINYDKYIKQESYCSDFVPEKDISDSDISEIDIKEIINEVSKNMSNEEKEEKREKKESPEDYNNQFKEKLKLNHVKKPKEVKEFYYKEKVNIDINTPEGNIKRQKMIYSYLEGLQWILYYYVKGIKSWRWYYPYHYAPMISDFENISYEVHINGIFENDNSEPFTPFQSLHFILPKTSFNLLPECYKSFPEKFPEYFPEKLEIDYNGKNTQWEAVLPLPFLDEKKVIDFEESNRKLSDKNKIQNTFGTSILYGINEIGQTNIVSSIYTIYQNKDFKLYSNYEQKKIDYSFPSLKTMDYDYRIENKKQYFGPKPIITKEIFIYPKMKVRKINNSKIRKFLLNEKIFIDYPYKHFGKIIGFIYGRKYYYLYKKKLYIDCDFKLQNDLVDKIYNSYEKHGIYLSHADILCFVTRFKGYENVNGKIKQTFNDQSFYEPFEITSLNATSNDFNNYLSHFNYEYPVNNNYKQKNNNQKKNKFNLKDNRYGYGYVYGYGYNNEKKNIKGYI